VRPDPL
jgi:hypothetical protein